MCYNKEFELTCELYSYYYLCPALEDVREYEFPLVLDGGNVSHFEPSSMQYKYLFCDQML